MNDRKYPPQLPAPLGSIEPHASLLRMPYDDQLLYKVITVENLLRSIAEKYLHFNRVDSYSDFLDADENDGKQLAKDQPINAATRFQKAPEFSAADYYDQSRARTYACCFSVENSNYIWNTYANGSEKGKACIVFEFGKLRTMLNHGFDSGSMELLYNGELCRQIFSLNYGLVDYIDWDTHRINEKQLSNPILYTYLKDANRFSKEKELRISLSTLGIGQFALRCGTIIHFPQSLQLEFDFIAAIDSNIIRGIQIAPGVDYEFLTHELEKLHISLSLSKL